MTLGADMCCDSAHKTLPVLTGGAYLHISASAPPLFAENASRAMALFASTSPSYLILQSLDHANAYLADGCRARLAHCVRRLDDCRNRLRRQGFALVGDEPLKLTVAPKSYGYTGGALAALLRAQGIVCEFADPDYLVLMFTPALPASAFDRLEAALTALPRRAPISETPPAVPSPERVLTARQAMLAKTRLRRPSASGPPRLAGFAVTPARRPHRRLRRTAGRGRAARVPLLRRAALPGGRLRLALKGFLFLQCIRIILSEYGSQGCKRKHIKAYRNTEAGGCLAYVPKA